MTESEAIAKCQSCNNYCPQAEMACEIAKGRMYATNELVKCQKELEQYRAIGTVSEFNQLKEINEKITEAVNGQLIAGKNNYKEAYECFHKIVDIVQGRIDWSEGKE